MTNGGQDGGNGKVTEGATAVTGDGNETGKYERYI